MPAATNPAPQRGTLWGTLGPGVVFLCLAAVTVLVWRQQAQHQRSLQIRHTEDTAVQASRRLQVFVESHLKSATIFARRWSTHEHRDFSRKRFEEFATVEVEEMAGYHAIALVAGDFQTVWTIPRGADLTRSILAPSNRALFDEHDPARGAWLSAPFESSNHETAFYAVLPLRRGAERLGFLVVEFRADTLIDACFHSRIQHEFNFVVRDGGDVLFAWSPGSSEAALLRSSTLAQLSFPVNNRTWSIAMAPHAARGEGARWLASIPVLAMGLALSLGLAWLVYLLSRRVEMYRRARDQALSEIEERQKAEAALRSSVEERKLAMARLATLSRKVLMAQEEERERLSRELHDELGQLLTALRLEMGWLQKQIARTTRETAGMFENTITLAESATDELRRICRGLRPPLLDDLGLEPALRQLVAEFEERAVVTIELQIRIDDERLLRTAPEVALCVYRIVQESLTNVRRHSEARTARVTVELAGPLLTVEIADDGIGFDPAELGALRGWGLEGMRERAALVGGELEVQSSIFDGTTVRFRVRLPVHEEEETP